MNKIKKISLFLLIIGYLAAGVNHFRVPAFYIGIIPCYLPHPEILNIAAGCCEILLALLLIFQKTREFAAWGIVFMLIAFIPVHIEMILKGPVMINGAKVSLLAAWLRLALQPVLIFWAWWYTEIIQYK